MNSPFLIHRHVFGLKSDVIDNIHCLDDALVLYPAGHTLVLLNTESQTQRFIQGSTDIVPASLSLGVSTISALAVSPNRRFVAMAEQGEHAVITVFDLHTLKKRKILSFPEIVSTSYCSMRFSSDSKCLLALTSGPDYVLVNWLWEKIRPQQILRFLSKQENFPAPAPAGLSHDMHDEPQISSANQSNRLAENSGNQPIESFLVPNAIAIQCSFCPLDASIVCVTGTDLLQFFRVDASGFKPIQSQIEYARSRFFTCHAWYGEQTLVGTARGDVLLFEQAVLRAVLDNPADDHCLNFILPSSMGLFLGCPDAFIYFLERVDDPRQLYRRTKSLNVDSQLAGVKSMSLSVNEEILFVTLDNSLMYSLSLANHDLLLSEEMKFCLVGQPAHHGAITGLDICIRKPLLVTCGIDRSVRIWSYSERRLELSQVFSEEPISVAFHPSGLHIIVGFNDKIRFFNLLVDSMRCFKELSIKASREIQFAHGGQYFAAAHVNNIVIVHFYTGETLQILRAHSQRVRSLSWTLDDTELVSAGADGVMFQWRIKDAWRPQEFVQKGVAFSSAIIAADSHVFVVGSDRTLKEIFESTALKEIDSGLMMTQLLLSNSPERMLFAGSEIGQIRAFSFPLSGDWSDTPAHSLGISRLRLVPDDSLLATVGDDGCLFLFDIKEREPRIAKRQDVAVPWAEEVLVTKSDLDEKHQMVIDLQSKLDELTLQNDYESRLKETGYQERIKEAQNKFQTEVLEGKMRFSQLKELKQETELEFEESSGRVDEEFNIRMQAFETKHNRYLTDELERYRALERRLMTEQSAWEERMALAEEAHIALVESRSDEWDTRLLDRRAERSQLEQLRQERLREYNETRGQIEDDADSEIETLKEKYETRLKLQREATLRLKAENNLMKKKFGTLKKDIDDQKEELKAMAEKQQQLLGHIRELNREIEGYRQEIADRESAIGDKERRISDLKRRNGELEKWKFVLDFRIKDLKRQIEPREDDITRLREEIKEKDQKLELFHKENGSISNSIAVSHTLLIDLQSEVALRRRQSRFIENNLKLFQSDVHHAAELYQQPKALVAAVQALFSTHVSAQNRQATVDIDVASEYARQRQHLQATVTSLKQQLDRESEVHRTDGARVLRENVALVAEINALRREMRVARAAQRDREPRVFDPEKSFTETLAAVAAQRDQISKLKAEIDAARGDQIMHRHASSEILPPIR